MSDINEKSNFVFEFQPVTKLFEEQVRLHPDKCAVASSKESFTYAQLNERANRIANSLIEKGVGCEKIVGVVLERCCDFYAVRQGILKAGGAFAVAAPDYPDDRVQFIFEDAGVPFIITTEEIAKLIGVDSLGYLEVESLGGLTGSKNYCAACFQGDYPTKIPADLRKDRFERRLSEEIGGRKEGTE